MKILFKLMIFIFFGSIVNNGSAQETLNTNSISFDFSKSIYWDSVKVINNSTELIGKIKFLENGEIHTVFENLDKGEYTIQHYSDFRKNYTYKLTLNRDTLIKFPTKSFEYKSKKIEKEDLAMILTKDTLQLLTLEFGCLHMDRKYYEIFQNKERSIQLIKSNEKIFLSEEQFEERISQMILNAKTDYQCMDHSCSAFYALKAGNRIYTFDDCCESEKLIQMLRGIETNKAKRK